MSDASGRYQRSMAGMIGALLVTLAIIVAYVVFRAVNRDDLDIDRPKVDYLEYVEGVQEGGALTPAYPPVLPAGWQATAAGFDAETLTWELDLLTDEGNFVGLRQSTLGERVLVEEYVDADAIAGDEVRLAGSLAESWRAYSDGGGDDALATDLDSTHLLVFGTAGEDVIEDLAASLVTSPL